MTQPNLLELAKQGDAKAIATLINRQLQPQGIIAKTALKDGCLQVMLESGQVPNQQALVALIHKWITSLGAEPIKKVKVYGRQIGETFPAWSQEVETRSVDVISTQAKISISNSATSVSEQSNTLTSKDITPKKVVSPRIQSQSKFPCPRTYLIPSILVTLFACLPAGVAGIVFATKVKQKYQQSDYDGALSASNKAKLSCIVGGSVGVFIFGAAFIHGFQQGFQKSIQQQSAMREQSLESYTSQRATPELSEYQPPVETYSGRNPVGNAFSQTVEAYSGRNPVGNAFSQIDGHAYLVGADGVFLGTISSNRIDEKSICNQVGDFGSRVKSKSVWNRVGNYGSQISDLSAYNNNANNPPRIIDENNQVLGILSVNTKIQGAVDPEFLHTAMCEQ